MGEIRTDERNFTIEDLHERKAKVEKLETEDMELSKKLIEEIENDGIEIGE